MQTSSGIADDHSARGPNPLFWVALTAYGALFPAFRFYTTLALPWPEVLVDRDFTNLWMAGYLTLHGRVADIFDVESFRHATTAVLGIQFPNNYSYPPHALFVALPFGALSYAFSFAVWNILSLALFYLAARPYVTASMPRWVAVLSPAALACLLYGHYGLVYGALWLWAFRGSGLAAGVMTIKPHLGLLVAVRLLRTPRALIVAVATAIVLVGLTVLLFGLEPWRAFFTTTFLYQADLLASSNRGRSTTMVSAYISYGLAGQIAFALAAIALLRVRFDVFTAATATFLIVPYGYHYDLTVVCLGFAVLLTQWQQLAWWERTIGCVAFLTPGLVVLGSWIVPPLLCAGLVVQVRHSVRADGGKATLQLPQITPSATHPATKS